MKFKGQRNNQAVFSRIFLPAVIVLMVGAQNALAAPEDFESFTDGQSINGQGGWTVEDSFGNSAELFDERIVDDAGNKVWRVSNATTSGSISNQPWSQAAPLVAGEAGAGLYNDYGTDHTVPNNPPLSSATATVPYFYGAFDFKSATGATQAGLSMSVSAGAEQSTLRNSFISITDTGSGFDLGFFDTVGDEFNGSTIATGLNYTDFHKVEMYIEFVDGIGPGALGSETGNDIVNILLDGSLIHTGTSWESYFFNVADTGLAGVPRAVDSLVFAMRGTAAPGTSGNGLYFDNVEVSNAMLVNDVPEPASLALFGLGLAGLVASRRRKA